MNKNGKLRLSSISNFISVPLPTDDYPGAYRHFYLAINSKIEKKCGLKIVKCLDEEKKSKNSFMALVNKSDRSRDDNRLTIKDQVTFLPHEMEYLKLLVDSIMEHQLHEIRETK